MRHITAQTNVVRCALSLAIEQNEAMDLIGSSRACFLTHLANLNFPFCSKFNFSICWIPRRWISLMHRIPPMYVSTLRKLPGLYSSIFILRMGSFVAELYWEVKKVSLSFVDPTRFSMRRKPARILLSFLDVDIMTESSFIGSSVSLRLPSNNP